MTDPELISNRPALDDLPNLDIGAIAALPTELLATLQEEVDDAFATVKRIKDRLDQALDLKFSARAAAARLADGKDTGTVRITDDGIVVIADLPKRVKWDQAALGGIVERIRAAGDDPTEYVTTELKVSERAYGAWPQAIRSTFAPARTVETGKPSYRFERIEGGAK
jgi:hypothetical protein